ncbi:MAG: acetylornithine deacetylase [Psychromonas sp.]|jgi:acetylornithine deacetylase
MILDKTILEGAITLLKKLISIPSLSRQEDQTANAIEAFFSERNIPFSRHFNNVWARNQFFDKEKPTILLNSHHDTVKPNVSYSKEPFEPILKGDMLFGLGSNDAGGPLVSLIATFEYFFYKSDLKFNLILAATAEEEISGKNGIEALLPKLPNIAFGIVGEPTSMDLSVAEKGLMVLDCKVIGTPGHAAREEGENAIYKAMADMEWFRTFRFPKKSTTLGEMKMSLTVIQAGAQHNVVPDECNFTVDVRVTDAYSLEETLEIIKNNVTCEVMPRSIRLNSSGISKDHILVKTAEKLGFKVYGSPTLSDQALMPFATVKLGPGESSRSHSADEFILISEIKNGVSKYIELLESLNNNY